MDHKPFNMEEAREKIRRYSGSSLPDREATAEEREHLKQQLTLLQEMQRRENYGSSWRKDVRIPTSRTPGMVCIFQRLCGWLPGVWGIPVEVMLGNLESNRGDVTVGTSGDAVTASDGTVFIKNDTQGFTPQEIVGHEGFHSMLKQQRSAALVYQETVMDQLSWSDPLAVEFLENITDHYFPNGYDATNAAQTAKFVDELSAYVSGMMNDGLDLSFLFRDYGRVRSDWEQMMGSASGDGNTSGGQTEAGPSVGSTSAERADAGAAVRWTRWACMW